MEKGDEIWNCPFCEAKSIKVWKIPAHREFKSSRGSGQSSGSYYMVPEKVTVMIGCKECGKSKKEIKDKLEGKSNSEEGKIGKCVWCGEPCAEDKVECEECEG